MDPQPSYVRARDGVSVAWVGVGAGPALIHLPGVPFSNLSGEWRIPVLRQTFEHLGRGVRFIQYDGRGTGLSQRTVTDLSMDAMRADLEAVASAAGLDRFALLGFYNSVPLAIDYAARHPRRVTGLLLFGGALRGWSPMSSAGTQALLSLIDKDWDTFVESAAHAWLGWPDGESGRLAADWFRTATTPAVAREVLQVISGVDVSAEAATVRCPVLVLHRRDAPVIPLATSEELAAAMPTARLEIIEGMSASLFFERTERIVRDIVGFVTGLGVGSPNLDATGRGPTERPGPEPRPGGLTRRELEVLGLLAQGETNAEIAGRLGVSVHTIERHVSNLYRKIDARGRADATAWAVRRGLA